MTRFLSYLIVLNVFYACGSNSLSDEVECNTYLSNSYAKGFRIQICNQDTILLLINPVNESDTVISLRVEDLSVTNRFACLSTTYLPFLSALNQRDKAVGVGFADYLNNDEWIKMRDSGKLVNLTPAGKLDFETVLMQKPDILLVYYYGNEDYTALENAGIKVIPISEYAESHPLGRAEWLKVFGLLTGSYSKANRQFNQIDSSYRELAKSIPEETTLPLVFTGSYYKGKWSAPGGDSFIATFIEDAGAKYAFADYPGTDNINLDFETVLTMVSQANFFGKVLYKDLEVTREDFLEEQSRFELLNSFKNEELFYCSTAHSDYFGQGILEPHLMLKDLIQIFHSNMVSHSQPAYFHPLKTQVE